MQITTMWLLKM